MHEFQFKVFTKPLDHYHIGFSEALTLTIFDTGKKIIKMDKYGFL